MLHPDNDFQRLAQALWPEPNPGPAQGTRGSYTSNVLLARTVLEEDDSYPETTGVFFKCEILDAGGDEEVGEPIESEASGAYVYAVHIGNTIPPEGAKVILRAVPYRWVFRYD